MARIAGIQFEKDSKGKRRYVRIDLKKHGNDIAPFLEKMGAIEEDEFERDWNSGLDINEAKTEMHKRINKWFQK
jgi:hypothetical protein